MSDIRNVTVASRFSLFLGYSDKLKLTRCSSPKIEITASPTAGFASISVLNPDKHDEMIAFLSQLTHCIAVSLMCANDNPGLVFYTGDSFRDLTRIARINDEMWSELFLSNREHLLVEMEKYRNTFDKLYNCIKNNDREEMRSMMRISSERREQFNEKIIRKI